MRLSLMEIQQVCLMYQCVHCHHDNIKLMFSVQRKSVHRYFI